MVFCGFNNPDILVFYKTADGFSTTDPTRIRLEYEGVVYREPRWICLADLNDNGWLDMVVPQGPGTYLLASGERMMSIVRAVLTVLTSRFPFFSPYCVHSPSSFSLAALPK